MARRLDSLERALGGDVSRAFRSANNRITPVDTGRLRDSFIVSRLRDGWRLTWRTPYARIVNRRQGYGRLVALAGIEAIRRAIRRAMNFSGGP